MHEIMDALFPSGCSVIFEFCHSAFAILFSTNPIKNAVKISDASGVMMAAFCFDNDGNFLQRRVFRNLDLLVAKIDIGFDAFLFLLTVEDLFLFKKLDVWH